ncbi:MAG: 3D domain-containing protein [Actinomycetota bacterium]
MAAVIAAAAFQFMAPGPVEAITLQELGERISKLSGEEEKLLEEIISSETEVQIKQEQIQSFNEELQGLEVELEDLYQKRKELKDSIKRRQELLVERIVYTYKYGNDEITKYILSARNLNEVVNNLYLFRNVMQKDAQLIEEYRYDREQYDRISRESEEKKEEIEQLKQQIVLQEQRLRESIAKNKVLLEQVKSERSEVQSLLAEIKKRIERIQPPGLKLVGEWEMTATAYYSGGGGLSGNGITAIGLRVRKGIVAVDPKVIPLGTKLYIPGYGEAFAGDTGGRIKGNRIDLAFESLAECYRFGRRKIRVYLVDG